MPPTERMIPLIFLSICSEPTGIDQFSLGVVQLTSPAGSVMAI